MMPTSGRNARALLLLAAGFFAGLQFRALLTLFRSDVGGMDAALAAHEIEGSRTQQLRLQKDGKPIDRRRVIYQCTCTDNYYWRVDLGRSKQWRRALQRIDDLVPEIETIEFVLDENTTSTCEQLISKDMLRAPPQAYEIIYSPWYRHNHSRLDFSQLNVSERNGDVRYIQDWGETFHGRGRRCNPNDNKALHFSHSSHLMPHQEGDCVIVHGPEIVDWATMIADYRGRNETVSHLLTGRLSREEAKAALGKKEEFAGLVVQSTWKDVYEIDSLVRHALCDTLTEQYKPCTKLVKWKGDVDRYEKQFNISTQFRHDTVPYYERFKFAIAMNNALWSGYMTEKEINPYLANSIAIVGTPDYASMANANRVVHCALPRETLQDAARWARGGSFMPFNTTPEDWERDPTIQPIPWDLKNDGELMLWAKEKFGEALQPCVEEIIRLDKDADAYLDKLMEPFVYSYTNSIFDGTYVAAELLRWLQKKGSRVTAGLESLGRVRIDNQSKSTGRGWLQSMGARIKAGIRTNLAPKQYQSSNETASLRGFGISPNKWRSSKSAVIGLAMGYELKTYQIFVGSLRATGYDGHIILGVQTDMPPEIAAYLESHNVTTKEVVMGICTYFGHKEMDGNRIIKQKCCQAYPEYKIQWSRFLLARDWLKECTDCTDGVLLTDVGDTFFQSDPFLSASPSPLLLFSDHPNLTISHWLVKAMVEKCHGKDALTDFSQPHLNSGSTMGSREGIFQYVSAMSKEFDYMKGRDNCRSESTADDQTVHNYLYYTGGLPDGAVLVPHRTGAVHVMAYEADVIFRKRIDQVYARGGFDEKVRAEEWVNVNGYIDEKTGSWRNWLGPEHGLTDATGSILNADGTPSPQVHQADRFGLFFSRYLKRLNDEVWSKA